MPSFGSMRQHGTLEPVDECFLSGWPELTADMHITNAPGALRVERQETAALGALSRPGIKCRLCNIFVHVE